MRKKRSSVTFDLDYLMILNPHDIPKRMKYTQFKMLTQFSIFWLCLFQESFQKKL